MFVFVPQLSQILVACVAPNFKEHFYLADVSIKTIMFYKFHIYNRYFKIPSVKRQCDGVM